jgi:Tat protein secretion system quality control protein TatD with DNase activity
MEADNKKSEYGTIAYKQTCESSLSYIQTERLNTETDYNTLDAGQKELIQNYRNYLKESANVVSLYRSGDTPDLSAMTKAKEKLY